ncbi:MAG: ankrd44, partial [Chthonomonadales bacterium]|nr:ankrd44 [Chthonomonadales bacterium]
MPNFLRRYRLLLTSALLILCLCSGSVSARADERHDYLNQQFLRACEYGSLEEIQRLIAKGADVHTVGEFQSTPMHKAAWSGRADVVHLLVEHGAKVDSPNLSDETPLMVAVSERRVETVKALLEAGANPNAFSKYMHRSVFLFCSHLADPNVAGIVRLLRKAGLKEHLWEAVYMQDLPTARALLAKGTPADERSPNGETPLMSALGQYDAKMFDLLLAHGADPNAQDARGETVLMHYAAIAHDYEVNPTEKSLLKHVSQVDRRDARGMTALMVANGDPRLLALLLKRGANIRARDNQGRTVLMHAADWEFYAEYGRKGSFGTAISFLLKHGAEVNARDRNGQTALLIATNNRQTADTVVTLLNAGANPNIADNQGITPLMWAARRGNIEQIQALRKAGAKVGLMEALLLRDTVTVNAALEKGADVNRRGPSGLTPLMAAAWNGDAETTERLLALGAKVNTRDEIGRTALHHAVGADAWPWKDRRHLSRSPNGPPRDTYVKDRATLLRLLIAGGARTDVQDKAGATPLQWAAHWGL